MNTGIKQPALRFLYLKLIVVTLFGKVVTFLKLFISLNLLAELTSAECLGFPRLLLQNNCSTHAIPCSLT